VRTASQAGDGDASSRPASHTRKRKLRQIRPRAGQRVRRWRQCDGCAARGEPGGAVRRRYQADARRLARVPSESVQ